MKRLKYKILAILAAIVAAIAWVFGAFQFFGRRRAEQDRDDAEHREQEGRVALGDAVADAEVHHATTDRTLLDNLMRDGAGQRSGDSSDDRPGPKREKRPIL